MESSDSSESVCWGLVGEGAESAARAPLRVPAPAAVAPAPVVHAVARAAVAEPQGPDDGIFRCRVIDDVTPFPRPCIECRGPIPQQVYNARTQLCTACTARGCVGCEEPCSLFIDGQGTLWTGLPCDPEPEEDLKALPIWRQHPQAHLYRDFPLSKLNEQLELSAQATAPGGHHPPGRYACFLCHGVHSAAAQFV